MRKKYIVYPFLLLILLAACRNITPTDSELPPEDDYAPRTLYKLGGVETLQTLFNEDAGLIRLILLVSPT
jgi:hypothetical protein